MRNNLSNVRTRWAAAGAAIAVTLGGGGVGLVSATVSSGDKPVFVSIEPRRILDTRSNVGLDGQFVDAVPRDLQVTGTVEIPGGTTATVVPPGATGVALNVTVVHANSAGFLSVRPGGAAGEPQTSNLNFEIGQVVPNSVNVDLPANGRIQVWFEAYTGGGRGDVLVDVVGYYDDHIHDDRYYTKAQVDATKFISLDVFSNPDINFPETAHADLADGGISSLNLDVAFNLTLPPDYSAGTPLAVRLLAYSQTPTTCNGDLSSKAVYVTRAGVGTFGSPTLLPANIAQVFTAADVPQEYQFEIANSVAMQPGDAVTFSVFGLASAPRCDLVITGAAVYYD